METSTKVLRATLLILVLVSFILKIAVAQDPNSLNGQLDQSNQSNQPNHPNQLDHPNQSNQPDQLNQPDQPNQARASQKSCPVLYIHRASGDVWLHWVTPYILETGYFKIQRSLGNGKFETVTSVFATGHAKNKTAYSLKLGRDEPLGAQYRVTYKALSGQTMVLKNSVDFDSVAFKASASAHQRH